MKNRWIVLIALAVAAAGCGGQKDKQAVEAPASEAVKQAVKQEITPEDHFAKLRDSEVKDTFAELDRNKDGKVEGAELPTALNARLLEADKDGDHLLTVEEMETLTGPWTLATYERFVKLDANSDGVLKDAEIEAAKIENWQREDWNGDGAVAIAEFNRLVKDR